MQADIISPSKTIEFFIENKNSELSIQNIDTFIQKIEGVKSVQVNSSSGQTKITLNDNSEFDQRFIDIQRKLFQIGYEIKKNNTNGVQGILFFGTMILGFLFVVVVITLFYYFGSLPSLV